MNKADTFINIQLKESKKIYFASDNHLGAPNHKESLKREQRFIRWLDSIKENASAIFLLGEEPSSQLIFGGLIILFGVGMILFTKKK